MIGTANRWHYFRAGLAGLAMLVVAGCGSSATGVSSPAAAASGSAAASAAPSTAAAASTAPPSVAAASTAGSAAPASAAAASASSGAAAAAPASGPLTKVSLRLDWLYSGYHAPFFLGITKGWYKDAGIDLTLTEGRGSGQVLQLVDNKTDTFGFASAEEVEKGVQAGMSVVNVADIMPEDPSAIFVLKKSGITKPQDLKGKTIAITPGGTPELIMPAFLKAVGLGPNDVTLASVSPAAKVQTLLSGKADAMTAPGWAGNYFTAAGGSNVFLYANYGIHMVGYGIVTNTATAKTDPDLVKRFVAVTLKSWQYSQTHQQEAVQDLAKMSKDNAAPAIEQGNELDLQEAMQLVAPAVSGKPFGFQSEDEWSKMQDLLVEYKVLKSAAPVTGYLTNAFIPAS